jgi:hypothetical protein
MMRLLPFILCGLLLCLAPLAPALAAQISTDKDDYEPGEVMWITGEGFEAGESITITISDLDRHTTVHKTTQPADGEGSFSFSWQNPALLSPTDVLWHARAGADGASSGVSAQADFTDNVPTRIRSSSMGPSSGHCGATITVYAMLEYKISNPNNWGPLPGMTLEFTLGSASGSGVTDATGQASADLTVPEDATQLEVEFAGSGPYNPVSEQIPFTAIGPCATPPVLTCPDDITTGTASAQCGAVVTFTAHATGVPEPTITYSPEPGSFFQAGSNTVVVTAQNSAGTDQCEFQVVVEDHEPPSLMPPPDAQFEADASGCVFEGSLGVPVVSDNCPGVSADDAQNNAQSPLPFGVTQVTWWVVDEAGNRSAEARQTVEVRDTTPPAITAPPDVEAATDQGACHASGVDLGQPDAEDLCGIAQVTNDAPAEFPVGQTPVTWTAVDAHQNRSTAVQRVTVRDEEAPVITPPDPVTAAADPGVCYAILALTPPQATDNCGIASITHDGPARFPVGETTVTWTATDVHQNTSTVEQIVTIEDRQPPVLPSLPVVQHSTDPGVCEASFTLPVPAATDNCGIAQVTSDAPAVFPAGETTVTWTAADVHGNESSATQTVRVIDQEPPVISGLEATLTFTACEPVDLGTPNVTDNCEVANVNQPSGPFPVGTTVVTWSARDAQGNTAQFSQTVTVSYGSADAFLPPMSQSEALQIKKGRTVPLKFRLLDCPGYSTAVVHVAILGEALGQATSSEGYVTESPTPGTVFRYSSADDQYIFNFGTDELQVGHTYRVGAVAAYGIVGEGLIQVTR